MVWAVFPSQVPNLSLVRSTCARPPVPILDLGGYAREQRGVAGTMEWFDGMVSSPNPSLALDQDQDPLAVRLDGLI